MKLLLTSAGIKNASIHDALVDLLGKPIAESNALCIPTAIVRAPHGRSRQGMAVHQRTRAPLPHVRAGVEVRGRAGAHRAAQHRRGTLGPLVRETDVLLVNGGDALYLCYWMRQSGLADLLPSLRETVWVGLSAGSMVMTPSDRRGLRRLEAAHRWRRNAGTGRFLDLPAPGSRGPAGQHHGRRRKMGGRHRRSGVRDRRRDRHQSGRRHRRGRLRGALEAVHPKSGSKRNGLKKPKRRSAAPACSRLTVSDSCQTTEFGRHGCVVVQNSLSVATERQAFPSRSLRGRARASRSCLSSVTRAHVVIATAGRVPAGIEESEPGSPRTRSLWLIAGSSI